MESEESIQNDKNKRLISLGPYYPWRNFKEIKKEKPNLVYPALSDILLDSKSYAHYLKAVNFPLNYDKLIPVPAKPMYSFNSIEIICQEFSEIHKIPIDFKIIRRISDTEKEYEIIDKSINLSNSKILLIDDIITEGDTKDFICLRLNKIGCGNFCIATLGKTDHNLYE